MHIHRQTQTSNYAFTFAVIKTREDSEAEVVAGDGRNSGDSGKTGAGGQGVTTKADSTTPTTRDMAAAVVARDTMTATKYHMTSNSAEVVVVVVALVIPEQLEYR